MLILKLLHSPWQCHLGRGWTQNKPTISKQYVHPELFTMSICRPFYTMKSECVLFKWYIPIPFKLGLFAVDTLIMVGVYARRCLCLVCVRRHKDSRFSISPSKQDSVTQLPFVMFFLFSLFHLIICQRHASIQYVLIPLTIPTLSYPPSTPLPTIMSFWVLTLFCNPLSLSRATTWAWVWNCLSSMPNSLMAPSLNTMSPPQLVSTNCQWHPRKRLVSLTTSPSPNHSRSWGAQKHLGDIRRCLTSQTQPRAWQRLPQQYCIS